jgi:hypothetical protein
MLPHPWATTALTSPPNIAFNLYNRGNLYIISSPTAFTLLSGEFAAAFDVDLTITVTAKLFGDQVGTVNFNIDETTRLLETFNLGPVTELDFSVFDGTRALGLDDTIALDNLTIAPEPARTRLDPAGLCHSRITEAPGSILDLDPPRR